MGEVSQKLWRNWNITVMAIGAFYSVVFLGLVVYNYSFKRKHTIKHLILYATLLHIISWLIHFICSMTTYIQKDNNLDDNHDNANYIICTMIILHPLFFYTLMTFRMYYAFKISVQKMNYLEIGMVAICVSVIIISRFIEQISWILVIRGTSPIIDTEKLSNCLWTFVAFDIFTRLLLVYLFVRKLFLIVTNQTDTKVTQTESKSDTETASDPKKKESVILNVQQMHFLAVIKKITLLGVFSALPLTIARIIFGFDFLAVNGVFTHKNWIIFNTLQCIAVFLELASIVLTFRFNQSMYYVCCKYCDVGCTKCCTAEAKRKITHSPYSL